MAGEEGAAPAAANEHRGEVAIDLNGHRFVLLPTFEAVAAIESQIGPVMALARRGMGNPSSLELRELAVVITEGMRAWGKLHKDTGSANAGVDKVQRMIFDAGIPTAVMPVMRFLEQAITGGAKPTPGKA